MGINAQNPAQVAQALANAQYNPAITSLQNLLSSLGNQDKFNQGQIGGWYTQMQNLMNSQNAQQGQNTQNQISDLSGQLGNVAQLFGANNATQMQPALGNAAGLLASEGRSNQDYLSNMVPLLAAQAAQSTQNEQNTAKAQQRNYQEQLTQQQRAKGDAYTADYQQALSNRSAARQNALAIAQARALMPYQVSSAKSQAAADAANAAAAPAYNQAKVAAEQAQAAHYKALTTAEAAAAQQAVHSAKVAGVLSPGTTSYGRVARLLTGSLYNAQGKGSRLVPDAIEAQKAIAQEAVAQGLIDKSGHELVKGSVNMLNAILASTFRRSPAWRKNFIWNTGERTGQPPHFSRRKIKA